MSVTIKFAFLFLLFSSSLFSQSVLVTKQKERVKGENAFGYATTLDAPREEVNTSLQRYLKTFGKPKLQQEIWVVAETSLNGEIVAKPLYSIAKAAGVKTSVWMGVSLKEWGPDSLKITTSLEGFVKTFGVNFYRDKIQAQIDEAQRAVDAVLKQQQRTATENKNLLQRTENNKNERMQLTRALQNNRQDSVNLKIRFEQNLQSKDSLQLVLEKVKSALEFQKERQRKVN
jgi:hypothetical protein